MGKPKSSISPSSGSWSSKLIKPQEGVVETLIYSWLIRSVGSNQRIAIGF